MSTALLTTPAQSYRLSAPNSVTSPKVCRDTIAALLYANGHHELVDPARLLVSEIVTNITVHTTASAIHVEATVRHDTVLVSVHDNDPHGRPGPRAARDDEESGRGLLLVREIAYAWGVTWTGGLQPTGKRIWFELREPVAE
ncbi:ATP-binding protein [Streptomyces sp. H27-D2]|uniref:ATP-binding protein n=1 Tax=Streptomyces sp. H27-D2 TaxID=3046304 RepID=UPI002DB88F0A|nr:ATP-binding protein [Streptomyces sp. H27-D2]MEC4014768.1 ATP-binding protein [Streptomyces sp. H27-D2]